MYLKKLQVKNFKSFQDISIEFNKDINILTGVNNSGKTTMLEAIALWHECFSKLIQQAKKDTKNYKKGDYVLGSIGNKYLPHVQINSTQFSNFEDIFYQCDKSNKINFHALFENKDKEELEINFQIQASGLSYGIGLIENNHYSQQKFNHFFSHFPKPIGLYFTSPIFSIQQKENFVHFPQIQEAISNRKSASVFRNRLYRLYTDSVLFEQFITDLTYIVFNNQQNITITSSSNPNIDCDIVFHVEIGARDTAKEISLLGSGTLQIMEILLNFYHPISERKDLNLVLLDEPDSHIHHDIQQRLLQVFTKFSNNAQIFLSTHNEALIRSASLEYLFHLDAKPVNYYQNLASQDLQKVVKAKKSFSGIYPSLTNPVISSLGHSNGLDFINAIEADYLIFVEGEEDARVIDILLRKGQLINRKRYVYWVLGGVSHILKEISHYETVFSAIRNDKTLWQKSVLFFDRDYLYDSLLQKLFEGLHKKIKAHSFSAYTFEATLLTDLEIFSRLLNKWGLTKVSHFSVNLTQLADIYDAMADDLKARCDNDIFYEKWAKELEYSVKNKANEVLFQKGNIIADDSQRINTHLRKHIQTCLANKEYYKLMDKQDVTRIINKAISTFNISFTLEEDFISLIQCVDKSTWFDEWSVFNDLEKIGHRDYF